MSTIYDQIAAKIIKEQELLMGPVAWQEANKVKGIKISDSQVSIDDNNASVILDKLVERYETLFGRAGREVCKDAVSALVADLKPSQIPSKLQ